MKSITTQLFVTLGVILLILVVIGIYFFVIDPYGLKPVLFGGSVPTQIDSESVANTQGNDNATPSTGNASTDSGATSGFELSSTQMEALASLGVDPAEVPSSISAEQEACFVGVLGGARVGEIKAGAVPSAFELFKAKPCI